MNDSIWTYIAALGSVGFGWLLNELGQWFRSKKEDKRIQKKVLYLLLETHFMFTKLDTSKIIELISEIVLERMPEHERTEESKKYLNSFYKQLVSTLIKDDVADKIIDLEDNYKKSLDDLALVDPISAYRLNGKNNIIETFDQLSDYFESVKEEFPREAAEIEQQSGTIIEELKPELLNSAIKDLEDEIKDISLSIGYITNYKAKKIIRNSKNSISKKRIEAFTKIIDKVLPIKK